MAEKKVKKQKVEIATRAPQKRGIFDNLGKDRQQNVKHPLSEIIIFPNEETNSDASKVKVDHLDGLDGLPPNKFKNYPVSPIKDYSKLPNSIRRAIKQGAFQGCSLQIYLYLYSLTRGAINPKRTVRTTKPKIKAGSDVGSHVTVNKHLNHLKASGYLKITEIRGQYLGNEYEVFIPEELFSDHLDHLDHLDGLDLQFLDHLDGLETRPSIPSQTVENKDTSKIPKTFFKDNTNTDDEKNALAGFAATMSEAARKLTNKGLNVKETGKWKELAELLVMELEIAATRADSISSVPAFLTEHLRRRLLGKSAKPKSGNGKSPQTDKHQIIEVEAFVAEPLTMESREVVLRTFKEYVEKGQRDFVMSFEDAYTKTDWLFLMKNFK